MKDVVVLTQPGGAGGRASGGERVALAQANHEHRWVRLAGSIGLFACRDARCLWAAVCPGCLGSLDVALHAQAGIDGMALFWCAFHRGEAGR